MLQFFSVWKEKISQYLDVRFQLAKLTAIDRLSHVLGYIMLSFILLFLGVTLLIFIGLGLVETFTYLTDSRIAGAFLTALFFMLCLLFGVLARKGIVNAFAAMFIKIFTDPGDTSENEPIVGDKVEVK